jgi:hypothetical protein
MGTFYWDTEFDEDNNGSLNYLVSGNGGYIAPAILATGNTRDERTFLWVFPNLVYEPEIGGGGDAS